MILEQGDAVQVDHPPTVTLLVHCVNNRAVWGAGFVLALGAKWPECRRHYMAWSTHRDPASLLGQTLFVKVEPHVVIANVCGQDGIGHGSLRLPALEQGLKHVAVLADRLAGPPRHKQVLVQMPRIGCGLAGGRWVDVESILTEVLHRQRVRVRVR